MRKLIAALGCRVESNRLYGKPLQQLAPDMTILEQILAALRSIEAIEGIVLGISREPGNDPFSALAERCRTDFIWGDPIDVLGRLIECAEHAGASDVFRVTTENPFVCWEKVEEGWRYHLEHGNDVTVLDEVPDGTNFEIYRLETLRTSHEEGTAEHRSEMCSRYVKQNLDRFQVEVFDPPPGCARPDLRFTVDYPEDLIFCRAAYRELRGFAPLIPLKELIAFADAHPELTALVAPYSAPALPWKIRKEDGQ